MNSNLETTPRTSTNAAATFTHEYWSGLEIELANRALGHHWFEAATLRFFSSRILGGVIGGRYFVSSERDTYSGTPRRYTVRVADDTGAIHTVGEFQEHATAAAARAAAKRAAEEGRTS